MVNGMLVRMFIDMPKLKGLSDVLKWFVISLICGRTMFNYLWIGIVIKIIVASLLTFNWSRLSAGYLRENGRKKPMFSGMSVFCSGFLQFQVSRYS
jgi:hypothetical protein